MRQLLQLLFGAFMVLLGVFMLSFLPKAMALYAELRRAGKLTADEARQKRRNILAGGVCAIAAGVALLVVLKS